MNRFSRGRSFVGGALITLMLSACSLTPTYERPAAPIEAQWPELPKVNYSGQVADQQPAGHHGTTINQQIAANQWEGAKQQEAAHQREVAKQREAAEIGWREFFQDARLRTLIALALENNRDLRIAVQRVEAARAAFQQQRGGLWPSIGVGVQGTRERLPPDLRTNKANSPAISSQYQGGLGLTSFELDFFGRLRNLSDAAYQQYLATEQAYRNVQISLIGEVAQAYLTLRAAQVQLALTQRVLAAQQESYRLVRYRFKGGVASALDLEQAKSLLDSASGELVQLTRTRAQALNALVLIVGKSLPENLPAPAHFSMDRVLAMVPAGLPSHLLTRRPDILSAEYNLKMANANIGVARAAFFPVISLTGMYGRASTALSSLWSGGGDTLFWSFSPSITAPIFAGGSLRAGVELAQANKRIAVAQYEQSIQQAFREVADALAGESTYATQLQTLDALVVSSSHTLKLADLRYNHGVDSYFQVQSSQINALNAQLSRVQTTLAYLLNRVQLYKALGGGWQEESVSQQCAAAS